MDVTKATKASVWNGTNPVLMARIRSAAAALITQSSLTSIKYSSRVVDVPDTEVAGATLTIGDVIFDELQTDDRWTADTTGYNFRYTLPAAAIPTGDTTYAVHFEFTAADGSKFYLEFLLNTRKHHAFA